MKPYIRGQMIYTNIKFLTAYQLHASQRVNDTG